MYSEISLGARSHNLIEILKYYCKEIGALFTLDAESDKNIKEIKILLKRNWSFTYHIFIKEIKRNILNLDSISFLTMLRIY
jgi:hypothetical protein